MNRWYSLLTLSNKDLMMNKYYPVLDKGFIALLDVMGSDEDIEAAARVSYQKGTRKKNDTRGLLRYCLSHGHTSIFEQAVLKFHVKAPIFVFRCFRFLLFVVYSIIEDHHLMENYYDYYTKKRL